MVAYIGILIILLLEVILDKANFKKYGIPIVLILLMMICGLRNNLGLDDSIYISIFNNIKNGNMSGIRHVEWTYVILSKIVIYMKFNYKMLFFIYSFFTFFILYKCIRKLNLNKYQFTMFILFYIGICFFSFLTTMRQTLAIHMVFLAAILMKENKKIRSIILVIVAGCFHNTAWGILPIIIFFYSKININNKIKIIIPISCMVIGETQIPLKIASIVNKLLHLGYDSYLISGNNEKFVNSGILVIAIFIAYIFQVFLNNKEVLKDSPNYDFWQKGQMLFFSIFFITKNLGFTRRLAYYFMPYESFILIYILSRIRNKEQKTAVYVFIIIMLLLFDLYIIQNVNLAGSLNFNNFTMNFID